ncbi:MAG: GGDEF domain-containing protein [Fibrobacter sp.]|nr:GGDEF domain-containing protein [Fibrobacter sp.]MDO4948089.1 GGDEF domain-containing protein [Fibrobacter sp.]
MDTPIDIRMALGTDVVGMILVVVMIVGNVWRLRLKTKESKLLIAMLLFCFFSCLSDLFAYAADGCSCVYAKQLVYITNSWVYASNFLCAYSWMSFLKEHFRMELNGFLKCILRISMVVLPLMLLTNLFVPLLFSVNEHNRYVRCFGYWIYIFFNYSIVVTSLTLYYKNYRQDGLIRFFPIWFYAIPTVVAIVLQSIFYGVSLMAPSFAVAIAGAFCSLQNERVFRDYLTGLFNRPFLDYVLYLYNNKKRQSSGIMVSLCDFSKINDELGHKVGDRALCNAADILRESTGQWGSILRYSGDEFIIMVDTHHDNSIANCVEKIRMNVEKFNRNSGEPYKLTVAIGVKKYAGSSESVDYFQDCLLADMKKDKLRIKGLAL